MINSSQATPPRRWVLPSVPQIVFIPGVIFVIALAALTALVYFSDDYLYAPSPNMIWTQKMTLTPVGEHPSVTFVENTDLAYINDGQVSGWRLTAAHQSYDGATSSVVPGDITNPYGCDAQETYISVFQAQEVLCYQEVPLPEVSVLVNISFEFKDPESVVEEILGDPANIAFLPSDAPRAPGTGTYFNDGHKVYYLFWLAGDCTPRIIDGQGGYWQMPTSPTFTNERPEWGLGYVIELPQNWQQEWRRDPQQAAPWRLCGASTFSWGALD